MSFYQEVRGRSMMHTLSHVEISLPQQRNALISTPGPGIAKPERRQEGQASWRRATIDGTNADQDILWSGLGILDEDIEIAVLSENPSIVKLIFRILSAPSGIFIDELLVGEGGLGIL